MTKVSDYIWNDYKKWLLDQINFNKRTYSKLMDFLHNRPFEYYIKRDENRAEDGVDLRIRFSKETDINPEDEFIFSQEEPKVLEVLIALAIRVDLEYIGDPGDPNPGAFFWEMCCNLGLDDFTNRYFDWEHVDVILDGWLTRSFDRNGEGSIFPIRNPKRDQREIEMWSQLQGYLSEKYH